MGLIIPHFFFISLLPLLTSGDILTLPEINIGGWMDAENFESTEWHTNSTPPLGDSPYPDAIVVPISVRGLSLVCNASYPVEWSFHRQRWGGRRRLQYALQTTRQSSGLDVTSFSSELSFFSFESNSVSGNYTCQKVGSPAHSKSLYIFWEGGSPPWLTLARSFRKPPHIPYRNTSQSFTLPCMVSSPGVVPHLSKEVAPNMEDEVKLNASVTYDPRVGFTLSKLPFPYGRYTCVGGDEDDENEGDGDIISFNVVNGDDGPRPEFNDTQKHGAYFYINSTSRELTCCAAGGGKPPKLKMVECDHPTICALAKHTLHQMESAKIRKEHCSTIKMMLLRAGVFRCVGAGIDVVREFFYPIPEVPQWGGWGRGGKGKGKGGWGGRGGRGGKGQGTTTTTSTTTPPPGTVGVQVDEPYYDWNEADEQKMMKVSKLSGPLYAGENRTLGCRVSHFYYARGLVWGITYQNESTIYVDGRDSNRQNNQHPLHNIHHFKIIFGKNQQFLDLIVTPDLKNITCYAPIWNATGWGKKEIHFTVKSPTAPQLVGKAHKEYSWYLNDTKKVLECTSTSEPWATVLWKKGNETVALNTNTTNGTSTMTFPRVTLATDGDYTCYMSNPAGTITKTFRVTVLHSTSGAVSAVLVFSVIGFVAVSAIAAVMFKYMRSQKTVMNHLANLAFKDVTGNNASGGTDGSSTTSTASVRGTAGVQMETNSGMVLPSVRSAQPIGITNPIPVSNTGNGRSNNAGFVYDYPVDRPETEDVLKHASSPPATDAPLSSFSSYHKF